MEDPRVPVIDSCADKYEGIIELNSMVTKYIPYKGISILYFEDSLGNLAKFKTDSGIYIDTLRLSFSKTCDEDSTKNRKISYTQQRQGVYFALDSNEAFSERASIYTSLQSFITITGPMVSYDGIIAGAYLSQEPYTEHNVDNIFTSPDLDIHPYLSNNYNYPVSSVEINGKRYSNIFVAEALGLGYTFDQGIVFFRDGEGQFWTLKEMK